MPHGKYNMYKSFLKRFFDIILSVNALLLALPLLLIVISILFIFNNGKPFFFQKRPGKNGQSFILIKFKTMTDKKDAGGHLLPDFNRLTSIGNFVRKTSLDEIPQLINVIKGDMSLVGPRPLLMEYLPLYNREQARRHEVCPGITGWAQINGRNAITWNEKFTLDVWYVDNLTFILDVKILFLTIKKVFKCENVNTSDKLTMVKFTGDE